MQYFGFDRPSFGIKTFGFGANFDPMTLFAGGKQGVWYDPSDKSTLFQDVAGTVPVTKDGDPVALMRDKSGNNNHATQSVSTARPIYKTDGILHWLKFDGVDDAFIIPVSLQNKVATLFISYIDLAQQTGFLLVDSGNNNPWAFSGQIGGTLAPYGTGVSVPSAKIKTNKSNDNPVTRDAFYKQVLAANVAQVTAIYLETWGSTYRYGVYTAGGFNCFNKTTGYVLVLDDIDSPETLNYLAAKSGVTL